MQPYAYRQCTECVAHYSNPTVFTASWTSSFASTALLIPEGTKGCQLRKEKRGGAAATMCTQSFTAETARPSGNADFCVAEWCHISTILVLMDGNSRVHEHGAAPTAYTSVDLCRQQCTAL